MGITFSSYIVLHLSRVQIKWALLEEVGEVVFRTCHAAAFGHSTEGNQDEENSSNNRR